MSVKVCHVKSDYWEPSGIARSVAARLTPSSCHALLSLLPPLEKHTLISAYVYLTSLVANEHSLYVKWCSVLIDRNHWHAELNKLGECPLSSTEVHKGCQFSNVLCNNACMHGSRIHNLCSALPRADFTARTCADKLSPPSSCSGLPADTSRCSGKGEP